ncbi:MAG: UPF0758 domain-containing protein [Candidatus Microsaccharimonas sp.]
MEFVLYQRPREKLQSKGVKALSVVELLQVILGSGSPDASGAKIARLIEKLMIDNDVTYETLLSIRGVGNAKTCQILAAFELSKRMMPHE